MCIGRVAVQFDHLAVKHAGCLMQPVDVLRDHATCVAARNQRRDRPMPPVRTRLPEHRVERKSPPPGFLPRILA